jgi:hypothetical protein
MNRWPNSVFVIKQLLLKRSDKLLVDYELGKVLDYLRFFFLNYSSRIGLV